MSDLTFLGLCSSHLKMHVIHPPRGGYFQGSRTRGKNQGKGLGACSLFLPYHQCKQELKSVPETVAMSLLLVRSLIHWKCTHMDGREGHKWTVVFAAVSRPLGNHVTWPQGKRIMV